MIVGDTDAHVASVLEALSDPHFRKQRHFGPSKQQLERKVRLALLRKEPIELVGLMFTRKNVNPLKRGPGDESCVDLAEIISLVNLNSFASLIASVHPFGARFTILSEGKRFRDAFNLSNEVILRYQSRMRRWIDRFNLAHIRFLDYEDFLDNVLDVRQKENRSLAYTAALATYQSLMYPIFDLNDMHSTLKKAIEADPVKDHVNVRNNFVPLWDSIKHSIPYSFVSDAARKCGVGYEVLYKQLFGHLMEPQRDFELESLRCKILEQSWNAAIEHSARIMGDERAGIDVAALISPAAQRTTIHPRPHSPHLGIHAVRETTSRVQPWHGTAYLTADGLGKIVTTVLTKLELESMGAIPVTISTDDGEICFYASEKTIDILKKEAPTFNMSMR